jgi:hypothetical protein
LLNVESYDIDDFDADRQLKNVDDWVSDEYMAQLTEKHPSKVSKAMAVEVNHLSLCKVFNTANPFHRDQPGRLWHHLTILPHRQ